jgi:hypothetical protein
VLWAALAVACVVLAFLMHDRAQDRLREQVQQAQVRAQDYADTVLYDALTASDVTRPMIGAVYRDVLVAAQAEILTDARVARIRLWSTDGTLIFSTDDRDKIGELRSTDDAAITSALQGAVTSRRATGDYTPTTTGAPAQPTELFQAFVPLRTPDRIEVQGAVELDQFWAPIDDAASGSEGFWQIVFIVLAVLFGAVAALSFLQRTRTVPATYRAYAVGAATDALGSGVPDDVHERAVADGAELRGQVSALTSELATAREELLAARAESGSPQDDAALATVATLEARLAETERERAAVDARALAAEEQVDVARQQAGVAEARAQGAEARAEELGALGERVEVAERRALDAERRLQELSEQVEAARPEPRRRRSRASEPRAVAESSNDAPQIETDDEPSEAPVNTDGSGEVANAAEATDLRARLARTAARKKPGGSEPS